MTTYAVDKNYQSTITENDSESIGDVDYKRYLKYIWIPDDWNENNNSSSSLRIDKVVDGVVSGRFCSELAIPEWFNNPEEYLKYNDNNMSGELINGVAECVFDGCGKGNIRIEFIGKNSIKAEIKYTEKDESRKEFEDGTFIYRPYKIKDHLLFVVNDNLEVETKLDSWGNVRIVSGQQETSHAVPVIYMTDQDDNILYRFGAPYQHDSYAKEVIVEDMNGDGFQDVRIITSINDTPPEYDFIWNFFQLENGWFFMERSGYVP